MNTNRREFMQLAGLGLAGAWLGTSCSNSRIPAGAPPQPLASQVPKVCDRLAPHGWRDLMLKVTGGEFDLASPDLAASLTRELRTIDRSVPGFEDFAAEGRRAIEPGVPARSLLFHALASPNVVRGADGGPLAAFPTLAELDAVENAVYGAQSPSVAELRERAGGAPLAVVVFAREYRPARHTVHRKHADLCFARTCVARAGNAAPLYDGRRRDFAPLDDADAFAFRVQPARVAAYVAMRVPGRAETIGPMRFDNRDGQRQFWVPLHKLFDGPECVRGLDLRVSLAAHFVNEKLRRVHQWLAANEYQTPWTAADLDQPPFVLRDAVIAAFSQSPGYGPGVIVPALHPLAERAVYKGKPLLYRVPEQYTRSAEEALWFSTLQILPVEGTDTTSQADSLFGDGIAYMEGLNPTVGRHTPEYVNARHEITDQARDAERDLSEDPKLMERLKEGGYPARHFIDFTGDGWVAATCTQLDRAIPARVPGYVGVAPPDFFPAFSQREVMEWWEQEAPAPIRRGAWCIQPLALSDRRMAANVTLPGAGFDIRDNTVTAIVSHPADPRAAQRPLVEGEGGFFTHLPDGSNGVFDPGWDFSQDTDKSAADALYLTNYGLGTPFIEDAKLCAALGSFWPAVAPDSGRTFQPDKKGQGASWPWPAIVPLTDEEIGTAEIDGGGYLPWDGVTGPRLVTRDGREMVSYPDIAHVDYINLSDKLTARLTSRIDLKEYEARVVAMAAVYWALGIREDDFFKDQAGKEDAAARALNRLNYAKAKWAVASFRKVKPGAPADRDYDAAIAQTGGAAPADGPTYRVYIYRYGPETRDPDDFRRLLVEVNNPRLLFVDRTTVLMRGDNGQWQRQAAFTTT